MSRRLRDYLIISAKGLAMGAADVVPGVSGGTIAFISGIYEELIETIHRLDFGFFKIWKHNGLKEAWKTYNLSFLLSLLIGIAISIISFAKLIIWLLEVYPIAVWSFFFGLIVASIVYIARQIDKWRVAEIIFIVIAGLFSYYITIAQPLGTTDNNWFLFFAGFIAIIAMILPGISGAFVLLLLGAYSGVIGIITDLTDGLLKTNWDILGSALIRLCIFSIGALMGLKVFSGALNWMFKNYKNITLAILTGFMVGALNKIWPWKEVLEYRINSSGEEVPFLEQSIFPQNFDGEPQVLIALVFAVIGFLIIFLLEQLAKHKTKKL